MMRRFTTTLFLGFCLSGAQAAELSDRDAFIVNNIVHVLYHEAGHAIIDQFDLPVLGQEEDAADSFATVEVLDLYEDPYFMLLDSAEANFIMQEDVDMNEQANYFGVHDLDVQRAYRIACVAVGLDAEKYGEIADWAELPEDRQETCVDDAELAAASWSSMLEGILKPERVAPTPVVLSYMDEGDFFSERALLKDNGVMEDFRSYLSEQYAWPEPLKVRVEQCGEANAFYDPEAVSITMCYELVRFVGDLEKRRQ